MWDRFVLAFLCLVFFVVVVVVTHGIMVYIDPAQLGR